MQDETIDVAPSADNGNVPVDAPSEPVEPAAPATTEPATPAEPVQELYDLPDGRKVDAATLSKEFKENFLPEFTRKSQELATLRTGAAPLQETKPENRFADPNYVPQTYDEIIAAAEMKVLGTIEQREQARVTAAKALEDSVNSQITEIKATDPTVNENALFQHATKYRFTDLRLAHQNMKDMSDLTKKVQQTTVANIQKRADPVSVKPGASGAKPNPSNFNSAVEYLRALKATTGE